MIAAASALGIVDPALQVAPGGPVVGTAEGGPFPATPVELGIRTRTRAWAKTLTRAAIDLIKAQGYEVRVEPPVATL